jgi:N-acetylneuraminic acid mutarotase
MRNAGRQGRRGFIHRDYFPVYAAIGAIVLVVLTNLHWRHQDDPLPQAATGTFTGWHTAALCPLARMETQGAVVGGKLYMIGGYYETSPKYTGTTRCDVYDPVSNKWARVADMPHAVTHAGIATDGTSIWVAGGYPLRSDGWQDFASTIVYQYNTQTNTWHTTMPLPQPRGAGAMVCLGRQLHFVSGVDLNRNDKTDHWILNIDNPTAWTVSAPIPVPRNHLAAVALNGIIYVAGGQQGTNDAVPVATLYAYSPAKNVWARGADMPKARSHNSGAAFVYGGRMVVAGGETFNGLSLADVIAYDPTTNRWLTMPPLPAPRHSPLVQPVGTTIVAADGAYPPKLENTTWVTYGPK